MLKYLLLFLFPVLAYSQGVVRIGTAAGTNTYTVTFNPPITSLDSRSIYTITFTNANTSTTVTLDPDGAVAATAIKDATGADPVVGKIEAGGTYNLKYTGSNFRLIGVTNTHVGNILSNSDLTIQADDDIDLDASADVKINGVSGTTGEFIGNVDGHLAWAVPPGSGGGAGVDNVIDVNTTTVGNITTGEDVLYSFTVDKDSIDDNEDVLTVRWGGTLAANGNTKTIKAYFGNDPIVTFSGTFTSTWTIQCEIIRVDANNQKSSCTIVGASSGISHSSVVADLDQDLTSDVVIQLTGESTEGTTNDIVKETATIFRNTGGGGGAGGGDVNLSDFVTSETPSGTVNGINDTFTLANTPQSFIHVYMDGLLQDEGGGNDYTISGTTITFVDPPLTGSKIRVSYIK